MCLNVPPLLLLHPIELTFMFSESAFLYLKKDYCYWIYTQPSRNYNSYVRPPIITKHWVNVILTGHCQPLQRKSSTLVNQHPKEGLWLHHDPSPVLCGAQRKKQAFCDCLIFQEGSYHWRIRWLLSRSMGTLFTFSWLTLLSNLFSLLMRRHQVLQNPPNPPKNELGKIPMVLLFTAVQTHL